MHSKRDWRVRNWHVASGLRWLLPISGSDVSATFFYLIGLILGLFQLAMNAVWWPAPFFIVATLLLFWFDHLEYQRYGNQTPPRAAARFLCLRFLCVILTNLLSPGYMTMLYLSLPYRTMIYFGSKAAYGMAALIMIIYIASLSLAPNTDSSGINISFLCTLGIICIWSILKAQGIMHEREDQQREYQSRIRAEELLEEVRRSHQQLQIYAEQVATLATIEERNRVAREIHDSLGHSLTAIHVQLEKALMYQADHPQEALQSVRDARDVAKEALHDVRRSVSALRTEEQPFSCVHEITLLAAQLRLNGLSVDFIATGNEEAFSRHILTTFYRIAQEGCTNIQRHAQARHVQISLEFGDLEACLHISDDGVGFDTSTLQQAETYKQSYGILGIQERLMLVNGTLALKSIPGQGTDLTATMRTTAQRDIQENISLLTERRPYGAD